MKSFKWYILIYTFTIILFCSMLYMKIDWTFGKLILAGFIILLFLTTGALTYCIYWAEHATADSEELNYESYED